jgi:hypothetical protein
MCIMHQRVHCACLALTAQASICVPGYHIAGLQFAACMEAQGSSHWDSNGGANYTVRLAPRPVRGPRDC